MLDLPNLKTEVILAPHTTFRIGGPAKYFFAAKDPKDMIEAVKSARENDINIFILGLGSNILISDKGFNGLVIKNEMKGYKFNDDRVYVDSGLPNGIIVNETAKKGLSGLEILAGVPGTIGGSIYGNAGYPKQAIGDVVEEITVLDAENKIKKLMKADCRFNYRESIFKNSQDIILSAILKLKKADNDAIHKLIVNNLKKRKEAQPIGAWCAGSVFKNPPNASAWQLIEKVGLKGKIIGDAAISDKHANFIINKGHATAEQVIMLICLIKQRVRDELGVQLREEIRFVGF